ncbi:MAG: cysteine desulfurase [Oscillospiraceae bacterium]|nr:cysteine desulfurase [Oscillospiraceae bacterium]
MKVYADNAATTKMSKIALDTMMDAIENGYGNPSSLHSLGRDARRLLERARAQTAKALGAKPEEIFFTSGGTEANNWAIKAAADKQGGHVVSTSIEHPAVLNCLKYLEDRRVDITYLGANQSGLVSPDELVRAIRQDTTLITVMTANNEVGTIQPIQAMADIARAHGITFHTDAVQAAGHIQIDVKALGVDMLSISGHKFGAPRGVGALYVRKGLKLSPFLHGGGQENGARSGTENTPGICALAAALADSVSRLPGSIDKVTNMRDRLIEGTLKIPGTCLTGDRDMRLPGIASFAFDNVDGERLVMMLEAAGICASSGSACASGRENVSHVLTAMGLPDEVNQGSLRLSINENNTDSEIEYILQKLPGIVERLRDL